MFMVSDGSPDGRNSSGEISLSGKSLERRFFQIGAANDPIQPIIE